MLSAASGVKSGISFVGAILLKKNAKQLVRRSRNHQKNAADDSNHKHPAQDMSHTGDQRIKHLYAPRYIGSILPQLLLPEG